MLHAQPDASRRQHPTHISWPRRWRRRRRSSCPSTEDDRCSRVAVKTPRLMNGERYRESSCERQTHASFRVSAERFAAGFRTILERKSARRKEKGGTECNVLRLAVNRRLAMGPSRRIEKHGTRIRNVATLCRQILQSPPITILHVFIFPRVS